MPDFIEKLRNPEARRRFLAAGSGGLILAGLAANRLLGAGLLGNGLMVAAAVAAGWEIAVRALRSARRRQVTIELLVTIATIGALAIGQYWEAAAVTFLFIFGAYLEARTLGRTRQVLQGLLELAPTVATVLRAGRQVEIRPDLVTPGETVLVKPGAKLAVDGEVVGGQSYVDESAITGEPIPKAKTVGSSVYAGTVNQDGLLKVRADGVGADTTLARIIHRVEEAQDEKAPTQRFIERFARWYTPFIIILSALVYALTRDVELALTLLVIGCPGALVISTPVSVVAGIGRAAKAGILIKGGEYLENAGKISALAFDKTGTLTEGRPRVTDVIPLAPAPAVEPLAAASALGTEGKPTGQIMPDRKNSQEEILRWAAIAEMGSEHPLARAIVASADNQAPIPAADSFESFTGRGVRATHAGLEILVGSQALMGQMEVWMPESDHGGLKWLERQSKTAVVVAVNGEAIGLIAIADALRPGAPAMVRELREIGIERLVMLTGDQRRTAVAIAEQAGLEEVRAQLLPEDKMVAIRELQADGHVVAMVGDGINDAPALAAADIGIAMGALGTDIAIETADIALMADDLAKLPEAVRLSRATLGNIHQNVILALATVGGLLLGVLLGKVHMAGGMLIHEASVLLVILNGMRLLRR